MLRRRISIATSVVAGCFAVALVSVPSSAATGSTAPTATPGGLERHVLTTDDSRFRPRTSNQGWWSDQNGAQNRNDNYIMGRCCPTFEYRDFFTFDLSETDQHIVSAELRVFNPAAAGDPVLTFGLFDVTTPAEVVNFNSGLNPAIFEDLGTGTSYGTFQVSRRQDREVLVLPLNRAAIHDLNAAAGGFFTVGGRLLNLDTTRGRQYVFGASDRRVAKLVVNTAPGPR